MRYLLPRTQGPWARVAVVSPRGRGWLARGREMGLHAPPRGPEYGELKRL